MVSKSKVHVGSGKWLVRPGARPTNHISIEFQIRAKFGGLLFKIYLNIYDHNEMLRTSWQLHCHGMCKISLWLVEYILYQSTPNFGRISNSIEIPLVGRVPGEAKHDTKYTVFLSTKYIWTCHLYGDCHCVQVSMCGFHSKYECNYANPVYGVATICHQGRWLRWGHPSFFHIATSPLIWYKRFCVRDISYSLIWMEFINMFSVYAQSVTHSCFNW